MLNRYCAECHRALPESGAACGADINGHGYASFDTLACGDAYVERGGPKPTIATFCGRCGSFSIELGKFGVCPTCDGEP